MTRDPRCLLCFLDDDYQADLRATAQHLSPRHERAMRIYKRSFVDVLERLGGVVNCPVHNQSDPQVAKWVDLLLAEIRTIRVGEVFDPLITAYELWICGHLAESTQALDALLRHHAYGNRKAERSGMGIFFRGRNERCGRDGLFHIPFTKRHCISNQRYSLSGQPLLYLGLSVLDVVSEIGSDPLNIASHTFCYYWLREPEEVRIFDIGNELHNLIWNNLRGISAAGGNITGQAATNSPFSPAFPRYKEAFVTFIIAAVCSFRRIRVTDHDAFASEYVLPQLLAHWARENRYDGIIYSSTRVDATRWQMTGYLKMNAYRENVAFFTNYDPTSQAEHDGVLLNRFEISDAIQFADIRQVSDADFEALKRQIIALNNANSKGHIVVRSGVGLDVSFEGLELLNPSGGNVPYANTDCGRVQRYLKFLFLNSRLLDYP